MVNFHGENLVWGLFWDFFSKHLVDFLANPRTCLTCNQAQGGGFSNDVFFYNLFALQLGGRWGFPNVGNQRIFLKRLPRTLEVQPPFFTVWFPNHHYFCRGLYIIFQKEPPFFKCWLTSRVTHQLECNFD